MSGTAGAAGLCSAQVSAGCALSGLLQGAAGRGRMHTSQGSTHPSQGITITPTSPPAAAAVDKPRRFLRLQSVAGPRAQRIRGGAEVEPVLLPGDSSFYGMLLTLVECSK